MSRSVLQRLRRQAVSFSLGAPASLPRAMERLGFVQADPIRAPARAQDLILRHRVKNYRTGDLERRYPKLALEEDVLYAYGFMTRDVWRLLHRTNRASLSKLEKQVLGAVRELGDVHPQELDDRVGRARVTNAWGGISKASKRALESLHRRGLLRVARRQSGIRVYELASAPDEQLEAPARLRQLVLLVADIFAPSPIARLSAALAPLRRRGIADARTCRRTLAELMDSGELRRTELGDTTYVWPARRRAGAVHETLRFLAPFDPIVWDRERFEKLWGWAYRFEAYTPPARRVRGYYAMPLLWRDDVIGWVNLTRSDGELDVEVGFAKKRPRSRAFSTQLDAEVERVRSFLQPR